MEKKEPILSQTVDGIVETENQVIERNKIHPYSRSGQQFITQPGVAQFGIVIANIAQVGKGVEVGGERDGVQLPYRNPRKGFLEAEQLVFQLICRKKVMLSVDHVQFIASHQVALESQAENLGVGLAGGHREPGSQSGIEVPPFIEGYVAIVPPIEVPLIEVIEVEKPLLTDLPPVAVPSQGVLHIVAAVVVIGIG